MPSDSVKSPVWFRFLNPTPVGRLLLAADRSGLRYLHFADGPLMARNPLPPLQSHDHGVQQGWEPDEGRLDEADRQLQQYFQGARQEFDLALNPIGTDFQQQVWTALLQIPWGTSVSYGGLAQRIGRPTAARAVGLANGRNPISIVIPCHRVIGHNGRLTGYGGGLPQKQRLLELEGSHGDQRQAQRTLFAATPLAVATVETEYD